MRDVEAYWGVCPTCYGNDGCRNIGPEHWFFCRQHQVKWCVGSGLFSEPPGHGGPGAWAENAQLLNGYQEIRPLFEADA